MIIILNTFQNIFAENEKCDLDLVIHTDRQILLFNHIMWNMIRSLSVRTNFLDNIYNLHLSKVINIQVLI